jgi:hypothetical protein
LLTLRQIRHEIEKRARGVGATSDDLPTYGNSRDFGFPHIEVDQAVYHWVVVERGEELDRRTFRDLDDLLFKVFESATHAIASRWELANRLARHDSRRLLFSRQVELLASLDPEWGRRQQKHVDAILREHPYRDD